MAQGLAKTGRSLMQEITSVSNNKIKEAAKLHQKKYRTESGLFLIEGHKPIFEAFQQKAHIETVYVTKDHIKKFGFITDKLVVVTDAVMKKIYRTDAKPEAGAVAEQLKFGTDKIKNKKRIALIENVKDAGNLGTLIRSAAAFSIDAIVLCGDTTDVYNPKVVRSTVGALFKIPVFKADLNEVKKVFPSHKFVATVVNHKDVVKPETIDYKEPFVIMLGSEADGLTKEALEIADIKTTIPISSNTESLNLGVAASILFYISSKINFEMQTN